MFKNLARAAAVAVLILAGTGFALADTEATPAPKATSSPLQFNGYLRSYFFTRQNASNGFKSANQASFNSAVRLHLDYGMNNNLFNVGASYLYANPLGACNNALQQFGPPCTGLAPPSINPDNTLPGYVMNTLYELYAQYKDDSTALRVGDQIINSAWAPSSDSRLKADAFRGLDFVQKLNPEWQFQATDMIAFENRVESNFDRATLLTSYPIDAPGIPGNTQKKSINPNNFNTNGFVMGRLGYAGKGNGISANVSYYAFNNLANMTWVDGKYQWNSKLKPFIAVQGGTETNSGSGFLGIISSSVYGVQGGVSLTKNVGLTLGYDTIPDKSVNVTLPAGVSCNATSQISGVYQTYFLPSGGTPVCQTNAGVTTIHYGGIASPYSDSYATDSLFTTSISQGMVDRRSPGSSWKLAAKFTSNDNRVVFIASRAMYNYGNAIGSANTYETNLDAQYFLNHVGKGVFKGWSIRERYAERTIQNTALFGGTPLFKYNRTQLEYDF